MKTMKPCGFTYFDMKMQSTHHTHYLTGDFKQEKSSSLSLMGTRIPVYQSNQYYVVL